MSFPVTKLIKSWSWASPPGLQNSQIHVLTLCHMTAEQEEGVRYSERMGSWLEGLSLNLATTAAIDLEFRLKFSNPHFISTGYWWNFIIIIQLVLHIHGFYFHEFNPPQVKNSWKKKKIQKVLKCKTWMCYILAMIYLAFIWYFQLVT